MARPRNFRITVIPRGIDVSEMIGAAVAQIGSAFKQVGATVDMSANLEGTEYIITVTSAGYRASVSSDRADATRLSRELNIFLASGADPLSQEIRDRVKAIDEVRQRIKAGRKAARARAAGAAEPWNPPS
ncbi:MAG TPA: hypothetical protein VNH38_07750 [Candidatus Dormibacteraeota bacterium]|nr:hypothetical protein [Candidatus Dormibacteraeota bacterium]